MIDTLAEPAQTGALERDILRDPYNYADLRMGFKTCLVASVDVRRSAMELGTFGRLCFAKQNKTREDPRSRTGAPEVLVRQITEKEFALSEICLQIWRLRRLPVDVSTASLLYW